MNTRRITGHVDEQHVLSAQVPDSVPPGPVTIMIIPSAPHEDASESWAAGIAHEWADELRDARQDIYTLNDGEPMNAA